jgi:outer membrane protein
MKHLFKVVAIAILLCASPAISSAQKIGHLDVDSLLKIWPKYQDVVDSLTRYQATAEKIAEGIVYQIYAKRNEIDSMKGKDTPLIAQLRQTQLQQLESTYEQYVTLAGQEAQVIQAQMVDTLYKQLDAAIKKVAKAGGFNYILDSSKGGTVMYADPSPNADVFKLVCTELKITIPAPKPKTPAPGGTPTPNK